LSTAASLVGAKLISFSAIELISLAYRLKMEKSISSRLKLCLKVS